MSILSQTWTRSPRATWRQWMRRTSRYVAHASWRRPINALLAKRLFDLTVILLALPFVLIFMALISVAILADSGRPIFFTQDRVGKGGRKFRIFKFRSLAANYDSAAHREKMKQYVQGVNAQFSNAAEKQLFKPFDEKQVTRVGRILRKTSLDELPQLWNVFLGQMSLIGPRPNVVWEVEAYYIWHTERLEVLPGITGLAQVRGRSGLTFDTIARYDIEYIRQLSLKLDLKIIWWTIASILHGEGAG